MREFDALANYPAPKNPRYVGEGLRTIENRIVASYRGQEFYDGDRNNGYGGFTYDGRWVPIVKSMAKEYGLSERSSVLQIDCGKGFALHDFQEQFPGIRVQGTEVSDYAIETAMESVKTHIVKAQPMETPFSDGEFNFVLAIGVVYSLTLAGAIASLKEIQRIGSGKSFITLASYKTEEELRLFRYWTLLGCTILSESDWRAVLAHAGYTGDYKFVNARSLQLVEVTSA